MNDETNIPNSDQDSRLARRIGERLEEGSLHSAGDDDGGFVRALVEMKRRIKSEREVLSDEASHRLWQRIDDATRELQTERPPAERRRRRPSRWVWTSAAAAILVAGAVAVLLLRGPEARLLASADAVSVEYTIADGSVVTLRPHSNLFLVDGLRYRIEGEAFFVVTEQTEGTFAVEAGDALVEVLGTRFNLKTWGDGPAVYLEEGRVRFSHRSSQVELSPGQGSRVTASGEVMQPQPQAADEHLDWLRGEMLVRERPLRLVAAEVEQHFGINLEIPPPILDETLSGRIPLDDAAQSLEDLGPVMGGRFVQVAPDTYRFESE